LQTGSTVQSPTHLGYSNFQPSSLQTNQQRGSRLRAASASLPLGLDLRTQFRSVGSGSLQPSTHSSGGSGRTASTSQLSGGVSSSYSGSFPSAPLTAPNDFSLPRTPGFRSSGNDYSMPQMSAPIAPPNDFSQAFQSMTNSSSARTPMRDTFPLSQNHGHSHSHSHSQSSHQNNSVTDRSSVSGGADYSSDPLGMKRKSSFSTGGGVGTTSSTTSTAQSAYGNNT